MKRGPLTTRPCPPHPELEGPQHLEAGCLPPKDQQVRITPSALCFSCQSAGEFGAGRLRQAGQKQACLALGPPPQNPRQPLPQGEHDGTERQTPPSAGTEVTAGAGPGERRAGQGMNLLFTCPEHLSVFF